MSRNLGKKFQLVKRVELQLFSLGTNANVLHLNIR